MKFKISLIAIVSLLVFSISGCEENRINSKFEMQSISKSSELNNSIEVNRTTEYISEFLINAGVIKIEVVNSNSQSTYKPITVKNYGITDSLVDLSNYNLVFNDNYAYLKNNSNFKLTLKNEKLYIDSELYQGYANETDLELFDKTKEMVTLILFKEIILSKNEKIKVNQPNNPENIDSDYVPYSFFQSTCSYSNTITYTHYGVTRSNAETRASYNRSLAQNLYDSFQMAGISGGCEPFGGIDSNCLFGNYACVATYSVCCE
ncbi:MAG: hypothetical protein RI558_09740 [Psychroflexus sp.]|nr:hypothetical protein [Psychroflexus sp.]